MTGHEDDPFRFLSEFSESKSDDESVESNKRRTSILAPSIQDQMLSELRDQTESINYLGRTTENLSKTVEELFDVFPSHLFYCASTDRSALAFTRALTAPVDLVIAVLIGVQLTLVVLVLLVGVLIWRLW